jgi:hypothetical protein
MDYQNKRGGRVRLAGISMPEMEFTHPEKVTHCWKPVRCSAGTG